MRVHSARPAREGRIRSAAGEGDHGKHRNHHRDHRGGGTSRRRLLHARGTRAHARRPRWSDRDGPRVPGPGLREPPPARVALRSSPSRIPAAAPAGAGSLVRGRPGAAPRLRRGHRLRSRDLALAVDRAAATSRAGASPKFTSRASRHTPGGSSASSPSPRSSPARKPTPRTPSFGPGPASDPSTAYRTG